MITLQSLNSGTETVVERAVSQVLGGHTLDIGELLCLSLDLIHNQEDTSNWAMGQLIGYRDEHTVIADHWRHKINPIVTALLRSEPGAEDNTVGRLQAIQDVVFETVLEKIGSVPIAEYLFRRRGENGFYEHQHEGIDQLVHPDAKQFVDTPHGRITFAWQRWETYEQNGYGGIEILAVLTDGAGKMLAHVGATTVGRNVRCHHEPREFFEIMDFECAGLALLAGALTTKYGCGYRGKHPDGQYNELFDKGDMFYLFDWDRHESVRGRGIGMFVLEEAMRFVNNLSHKRPVTAFVADLSPKRFAHPVCDWSPAWLIEELERGQKQIRDNIKKRKPYRLFGKQTKLYEIDIIRNDEAAYAVRSYHSVEDQEVLNEEIQANATNKTKTR